MANSVIPKTCKWTVLNDISTSSGTLVYSDVRNNSELGLLAINLQINNPSANATVDLSSDCPYFNTLLSVNGVDFANGTTNAIPCYISSKHLTITKAASVFRCSIIVAY